LLPTPPVTDLETAIAMPFSSDTNQYAARLEQLMRKSAPPASAERPPSPLEPASAPPSTAPEPPAPPPPAYGHPFEFLNAPRNLDKVGLAPSMIEDHIIRTLYFANEMSAAELAQACGLPYRVLDVPLKALTKELFLDIKGQRGVGDAGYIYCLSSKGKARARVPVERPGTTVRRPSRSIATWRRSGPRPSATLW
jgi:hypothetical protein